MSRQAVDQLITTELTERLSAIGIANPDVVLDLPAKEGFGDFTSNTAMVYAKQLGMNPRQLAEKLVANFPTDPCGVEKVEIAGPGFINFHLSPAYFQNELQRIIADPVQYGQSDEGRGEKWHFEFVSANPTGPLNIVSARAATIGSTLVRCFRQLGYTAFAEYYVNDAGGQIQKLGQSLLARANGTEIPEGGYHGDYLMPLAEEWVREGKSSDADSMAVGRWTADRINRQQQQTLDTFLVQFDLFFRESELYASGIVSPAFEQLKARGLTYEKEGAVWFKASEFGDSEDRVLVTSDGRFTYIVPDIAYHLQKYARGYAHAVNLLGPDHHGHILQLQAALKALDIPSDFFHPFIIQQVNLKRDGEPVKMSKRAGVGITLDELIEEVGVDAARFFFLMRKMSTPLDFDLEVAKRNSDDNPVFYVQYAHARIRSILRQPGVEQIEGAEVDYSLLTAPEEIALLRHLSRYPAMLRSVVRNIDPHPVTVYLIEMARLFHLFYARQRVISDSVPLTTARVSLCLGVAGILRTGLELVGVTAPDRM